ncbi:uncharacterized protein DS421_3g102480 [Arachis hypogaea]|nr:uncharacterized protein DS421_3g102480 [Arachis hypogaea]
MMVRRRVRKNSNTKIKGANNKKGSSSNLEARNSNGSHFIILNEEYTEQIYEEIVHEELYVEESMQNGPDIRMEQHGPCTLTPYKAHKKMKDQSKDNKNGLNGLGKVNKDKIKTKLVQSHTLVPSDSTSAPPLTEKVSSKNLEKEAMECENLHKMSIIERK